MILAYMGQAFLGIALLLAILQATGIRRFFSFSPLFLAYGQFLFVGLAFAILLYAHMTDEFALLSVVLHSHTQKPMLYKISGVWGNHEGSMLLWTWFLTGYGAILTSQLRNKAAPYPLAIPLTGFINFGFLLFILMVCDPFVLMESIPTQGQDLNPLLQDLSLAIHPPILYLGYGGFSIPFVLATAVLVQGKVPETWTNLLRTWVIWAWTLLTLGVILGSFWAYYELGWGGWWFWDPVENVALMPWLAATALLHTLHVTRTTKALNAYTIFLCILTFSLCLIGTFLVRSGLLTSIHSFAIDTTRGIFILILSALLILPVLGLFLWRLPIVSSSMGGITALSRSGLILLSSLILMCGTATIALGTFYPLILEVFNKKITVGNPYFNTTFIPMMVPLLGLLGLGPWYGWKDLPSSHVRWLVPICCGTLTISFIAYLGFGLRHALPLAAFAGAVWTIIATIAYAIKKNKFFSGMILSHLGIGIAVLGMTGSILNEKEIIKAIHVGETFPIGPGFLRLKQIKLEQGPNYNAQKAVLQFNNDDTHLIPEKRFYWTQKMIHSESAIRSVGWGYLDQVYVTLGEEYEGQRWSIHAYYKPFINLLWSGALITVLGGFIAFAKRFSWVKNILPLFILLLSSALGLSAHEQLRDPVLEGRARQLSKRVLCPLCQGQTLDESPIESAVLLRAEIRDALGQGKTDQQIFEELKMRYGNQVMITPEVNKSTYFLWFAPWVIFIVGLMGWCVKTIGRRQDPHAR